MSETVRAERFFRGHAAEWVDVTVNPVDRAVYLHIAGRGPSKSFRMTMAAWKMLNKVVANEEVSCGAREDVK